MYVCTFIFRHSQMQTDFLLVASLHLFGRSNKQQTSTHDSDYKNDGITRHQSRMGKYLKFALLRAYAKTGAVLLRQSVPFCALALRPHIFAGIVSLLSRYPLKDNRNFPL